MKHLPTVTVCAGDIAPGVAVRLARAKAAEMFTAAGVRIQWHSLVKCPTHALQVTFLEQSRPTDHPAAFAYAQLSEGTHIVVFYDRVKAVSNGDFSTLLAHVLVHEITRVLQGTARHSETGIMKATFTPNDQHEMRRRPLTFEKIDIRLIHHGLELRESNAVALLASGSR